MRPLIIALSSLLLTTSLPAPDSPSRQSLTIATDLAVQPDGERVAVLLPGATVQVLETREGWSRVAVEGWIRSETEPAAQAAPSVASTPLEASIAGSIFVTDEAGRTSVGGGIAVRLLRDPGGASAEITSIREECDRARSALKAEADALKDRGARAMKTIENPGRAFEAYDEAKRQRADKLRDLKKLDATCDARAEAALDARTLQRALTNAQGAYVVDRVAPGSYALHAAFEAAGTRHVWDLDVTVGAGQRLTLDLTNANRTGRVALPAYR